MTCSASAGTPMELPSRTSPTCMQGKLGNVGLLRRAVQVEALPESWRTYFQDGVRKRDARRGR